MPLNKSARTQGFTLVEMLVIAPLALLVIAGFIGLMVNMTGDVLATQQRSRQLYNTENALDEIQQDVHLSNGFASTVTASSPQGKNNDATAWNASAGGNVLLLNAYATTSNPADTYAARSLVYLTTPNSCSGGSYIYNAPYVISIVYFVAPSSDGSSQALWRRTILPAGSTCQTPWQRSSCALSATLNSTTCQSYDEEVLDGLPSTSSVSFTYYAKPGDTTPVNDPTTANTVDTSLTTTSNVSGKPFTYATDLRSTTIN